MKFFSISYWRRTKLIFIVKSLYRFVRYKEERSRFFREKKIKRQQDKNLEFETSASSEHLIIFLVPGADRYTGRETVSGGVISLVSLCEESRKLRDVHEAETLMSVYPRDFLLLRHENFENKTNLYRFEQFPEKFKKVKKLVIHIPELYVSHFKKSLFNKELEWILNTDHVHINVINANILLMPSRDHIHALYELADQLTVTAAHSKYCTMAHRNLYGVPLHKFSAWISPEGYVFKPYSEKENLLVVSPDSNPFRDKILKLLEAIAGLQIIVLQNFSYQQFKQIIGRAKWALTFGEGLDGYILEPIFSGSFGLAVYNEDFFTEDFQGVKGIYSSYEEMASKIVSDLQDTDNATTYSSLQRQQYEACAKHYSYAQYQQNILDFYLERYTFK